MPENPNGKKEENSQSSKNIQIPPIPKQTAWCCRRSRGWQYSRTDWRCCRRSGGRCYWKSRREATPDCSSFKADRSQRHENFQNDLEKTTQRTPEQKNRCQTQTQRNPNESGETGAAPGQQRGPTRERSRQIGTRTPTARAGEAKRWRPTRRTISLVAQN